MNIQRYVGIPWKTGGRPPGPGLDCWGLLMSFYANEFGINLQTHPAPPGQLAIPELVAEGELDPASPWTLVDEPQDGDGVALGNDGKFSHVGVYFNNAGEPSVIHTTRNTLSAIIPIQRMQDLGWTKVAFYSHAERPVHQ